MKYSQQIGIIACMALIASCFLPWVYVPAPNVTINGFYRNSNFGRPGLLSIILCSFCVLFFSLPKVWAKLINLFLATLNVAWCIKNFIVLRACPEGENCPQPQVGIYLQIILGIVIFVMVLFPKIKIVNK